MFEKSRELTPIAALEYPLGTPPTREAMAAVAAKDPRVIEFARDKNTGVASIWIIDSNGRRLLEQEYVRHSPTGLEFGYGGSGPGDTALNILSLVVSPREAWRLHHDFKFDHVATVPRQGATLTLATVREWIGARYLFETSDTVRMTEEEETRQQLAQFAAEEDDAAQADGSAPTVDRDPLGRTNAERADDAAIDENAPAPDVFKGRTKRRPIPGAG